ncbi:MAG TPA: transposase [Paludibacteraceae bacterium]|nr:transposase [Paludibacteraceae bacterium]HPD59324.1 transposase [Paludibacteraceae bacterium]
MSTYEQLEALARYILPKEILDDFDIVGIEEKSGVLNSIFLKDNNKIKYLSNVAESQFKSFNTIAATVYEHHEEVLNFFINRSTNASAESFNAKIKSFRASLRGVIDIKFFLFRLTNIYA